MISLILRTISVLAVPVILFKLLEWWVDREIRCTYCKEPEGTEYVRQVHASVCKACRDKYHF